MGGESFDFEGRPIVTATHTTNTTNQPRQERDPVSGQPDEQGGADGFCPTCGALSDEACINPDGSPRDDHKSRHPMPEAAS